eukprot:1132651-Prorocentrum_minimum.AAC.1
MGRAVASEPLGGRTRPRRARRKGEGRGTDGRGFWAFARSEGVVTCEGVVWSSEDTQGPEHRLQTANQGVQYVKGSGRKRH